MRPGASEAVAADRNAHAVHADEQYINERRPTGVYPMAYYPHNYHMMWYALNMLGRSQDALKAARGVVKNVPANASRLIRSLRHNASRPAHERADRPRRLGQAFAFLSHRSGDAAAHGRAGARRSGLAPPPP